MLRVRSAGGIPPVGGDRVVPLPNWARWRIFDPYRNATRFESLMPLRAYRSLVNPKGQALPRRGGSGKRSRNFTRIFDP